MSGNALEDISALSALPHLLTLKADHNRLTNIKLQEVKITMINGVLQSHANKLCIIIDMQFQQLQYLQIVDLSHNRLTSTEGLAQPMLDRLNLSCKKQFLEKIIRFSISLSIF